MVFVIHWHESDMDLHVFPIPIPPPTSLSTGSLWVFPVHQPWALVSCISMPILTWVSCTQIYHFMKRKRIFSWLWNACMSRSLEYKPVLPIIISTTWLKQWLGLGSLLFSSLLPGPSSTAVVVENNSSRKEGNLPAKRNAKNGSISREKLFKRDKSMLLL